MGLTKLTRTFSTQAYHKRIVLLALPMILSNLTTPFMGMVDTALLGHMPGSHYLAGVALAALLVTQLYWLCGFIRMSSTGLSAQAKGRQDPILLSQSLYQGLAIGLVLGLLILLLHPLILQAGIWLSSPDPEVSSVLDSYFSVRILGAPAALANLALIGWLIGQQQTKRVLFIQIAANLLNAGLSIFLVYKMDMGVIGVAGASVFAEYFIFALSLRSSIAILKIKRIDSAWFHWQALSELLSINSYTFVRNLSLQLCLAFLVIQGLKLGQVVAATNAILMQYFSLIALGLDGIAYAVEALVGEAKGQQNQKNITSATLIGLFWSGMIALLYSLVFLLFANEITGLMTDQEQIKTSVDQFVFIIILLPIAAHWCFLLDGVFVGLTRAKAMQNSMLASCLLVYFPMWYLLGANNNHVLWYALLVFMLARGISLGGYFTYLYRCGRLAV